MTGNYDNKSASLEAGFTVGEWFVEPNTGYLRHGEHETHLEPRVMSLLVCLAAKKGEVVSREELEATVWQGSVVGYDALTSAMIKLRKAFHDNSKSPRVIETVSKRGYRLIADVSFDGELSHEKPVLAENASTIEKIEKSNNLVFRAEFWMGLVFILAGLIFLIININSNPKETFAKSTTTPSIIVLPFTNIATSQEQDYFSDGITENIITDLSHLSALKVLARNTSFRYKGQTIDPVQVGKNLEVDYILEGSVQKSGKKLRITAQLIDTANGFQVWAERYDRELVEVFAVQDDVTQKIVNALELNLTTQEEAGLKHVATNNVEAYDLFLQGLRQYTERTKEALLQAEDTFQRAIKLDVNYPRPYGALAVNKTRLVTAGWSDRPKEDLDRALVLAKKAISFNNAPQQAYWALGFVHLYRKEYQQAIKAIEQSIKIAPSYADGYGLLALVENTVGNGEKARKHIKKGYELNPYYSYDYPYNLGRAHYLLGQYELAEKYLLEALERNENVFPPRLCLIASYIAMGRQDDAEWEVENVLNSNNQISITHLKNFGFVENNEKGKAMYAALRKAGIPE